MEEDEDVASPERRPEEHDRERDDTTISHETAKEIASDDDTPA